MKLTKNGITITAPKTVLIDLVLERLNSAASVVPAGTVTPPAIGERWHGQGGIFVGLMRGRDGAPDYALVLGPMLPKGVFRETLDRAAEVEVEGHADFRCPSRKEQALLFANVSDSFDETWYWSGERRQGLEHYAWAQHFEDGFQDYYNVFLTCLGVAVRAVII